MSSSKGLGATSKDISDLLPAPIFRLALLGRDPVTALSVDPNGDAVPFLWDWHDKIAEKFWSGVDDDDARLFSVLYAGRPPERMYLPRFSSVAFIVQMPHIDLVSGIEQIKESPLTEAEKSVLLERAAYTKIWVEKYASEKYRFTLQTELPDIAKFLTKEQKDAMKTIYDFIVAKPDVSGEDLHHELHRIKEGMGVSPKELFGALYKLFLGRESGPQAGWFLATLDRTFVLERLQETLT
jgi:lysyl-tRNA synthetase class 1